MKIVRPLQNGPPRTSNMNAIGIKGNCGTDYHVPLIGFISHHCPFALPCFALHYLALLHKNPILLASFERKRRYATINKYTQNRM